MTGSKLLRLRLSPNQCTCGVLSGKLPRLIVNERGVEVDPAKKKEKEKKRKEKKKEKAVQETPEPKTKKKEREKKSNGQVE